MNVPQLHQLYQEFQSTYPIERLQQMTLPEYTNLVPNESFCNWVEAKTSALGSIWGGSSYKFGIFMYNNIVKDNIKIRYDDTYAWYARYNAETAVEAFEIVKEALLKIADAAKRHDLTAIEEVTTINGVYKWKIAFLYSDLWIVPIYSHEWLRELCINFGMADADKATAANFQEFLISRRGNVDPFEYYSQLLLKVEEMGREKPHKVWSYAPGREASEWNSCVEGGFMCLGWEAMGDCSRFNSIDEILKEMRIACNNPNGRFPNDTRALWEFTREIKPGDIVYAKKGLYKIIGRGIVEGGYEYDESRGSFPNIRKVKWTHIGEWVSPHQLAQKTLTDVSKYPDFVDAVEQIFQSTPTTEITDYQESKSLVKPSDDAKYWWLVATPKVYTFAGKPVGERQKWTLRNDNGHKRKVFKDFEAARVGDIVICYDANPTKQIVALAVVTKASDGEEIEFQKTESLAYPVDWTEIKDNGELAEMKFVKSPMAMTFCSLTDEEADALMSMIREKNVKDVQSMPPYTKEDFLNEVFMDKADYESLVALLLTKKNIVLQGAPGVGKTFTAKRLAYSILGVEDPTKVEMVQFHQNYSYEDFIMGYKPTEEGGFDMRNGVFYSFCKRAAIDKSNKYFFIIDEINRGNLSKIFGELLMLIENGYREKEIKLAYRQEEFAVPDNVYIIGMMNTADRSLAMIDYALRRRFSFFDIKPGFDSDGFRKMQAAIGNAQFDKVVDAIKSLNGSIEVDSSLGAGFCIGHSYFCIQDNADFSDMWLHNVVEYDIVPMLREYWFDNPDKSQREITKVKSALK